MFQNCTTYESSDGVMICNDDYRLNMDIAAGKEVVLPTRLKYINGGSFGEVQIVRRLEIYKEDSELLYSCVNQDVCIDSGRWSVRRRSSEKFDFNLTLSDAGESDSGMYTIRYEVAVDQTTEYLQWGIDVVVQQGDYVCVCVCVCVCTCG